MTDLFRHNGTLPFSGDIGSPEVERQRALKYYRAARAGLDALRVGVPREAVMTMCGFDGLQSLEAAFTVAQRYDTERSFLAAYEIHDPPIGMARCWDSLVAVVGSEVGMRTPQEAAEEVRRAVRLFVGAVATSAPTDEMERLVVDVQTWVSRTLPPTPQATELLEYIGYGDCAFCQEQPGNGYPRRVSGVMVPCCDSCTDEPDSAVSWLGVVHLYKAYAHECHREAEILRNRY